MPSLRVKMKWFIISLSRCFSYSLVKTAFIDVHVKGRKGWSRVNEACVANSIVWGKKWLPSVPMSPNRSSFLQANSDSTIVGMHANISEAPMCFAIVCFPLKFSLGGLWVYSAVLNHRLFQFLLLSWELLPLSTSRWRVFWATKACLVSLHLQILSVEFPSISGHHYWSDTGHFWYDIQLCSIWWRSSPQSAWWFGYC